MTKMTIVALHGNGGGAFRFSLMSPYIPMDVHFRAVTLPGFAAEPVDTNLQTLADYAHYLHGMIKEEERPFIFLGTGIGGSIVLEYMQHYTSSIDGLILHAPVGTRINSRLFPRLMKLPGSRTLGQWLISARLLRPFWQRRLFTQPLPTTVIDHFFNEYRQCRVFGQMFDLITADWFQDLRPIQVPTALLWGEQERVLSVEQLNDYKGLLPHHIIRTVPEWDHFPMLEQPAAYTKEVVQLAKQLLSYH